MVSCLQDVAVQVGANRVVRPRRSTFHYPLGAPELDPQHERAWRRGVVEAALRALQTPVGGPTVFDC